jgi:putative DNA primase/helicase
MSLRRAEQDIAELVLSAVAEPRRLDLDLSRLPMNDYGNGQRLVRRFGKEIVSVDGVGWHVWDGKRWNAVAGEAEAMKRAHEAARAIHAEAAALRHYADEMVKRDDGDRISGIDEQQLRTRAGMLHHWAIETGNTGRSRSMLAAALPYLRLPASEMDAKPYYFNCENGTLIFDRSGEGGAARVRLKRHDPDDRITKLANVAYRPGAECPLWREFNDRVLPDEDVQRFLQAWHGYCLTADTSEQKIVIKTGRGANGKSTYMDVMKDIFADYSVTLQIDSLMFSKNKTGSGPSPDLAQLPAKRYVTTTEPESGQRLSESIVKVMTGGEIMTARNLNQPFIEFRPQFKVTMAVNVRPTIRGQDEGIWRRIRIVPFDVTIPAEERDLHLAEKLKAERDGILLWMLDGLRDWMDNGLIEPTSVHDATGEYKADSDPINQFAAEALRSKPGNTLQAKVIYKAYAKWAKTNGFMLVSQKRLGEQLTALGYKRTKIGVYFYQDIELIEFEGGDEAGEDAPHDDTPPPDTYDGPE